jgi:ribonuclease HI
MANKKKYYAVAKGHKPGIYEQWFGENGAEVQIKGFSGAVFKKFADIENAKCWMKEHTGSKKLSMFDKKPECSNSGNKKHSLKKRCKKSNKPNLTAYLQHDQILCESEDKVFIYTDGGCIGNPGPGGFGVVMKYKGRRKEMSEGYRKTTNNRMELMACIVGLEALKKRCSVIIYSDSRYVINGIEKKWALRWRANSWMRTKTESAENVDLWEKLLELCEKHDVEFKWVKGHAGNTENERCDQLAKQSALKSNLPPDIAYETGKTKALRASEYFNS